MEHVDITEFVKDVCHECGKELFHVAEIQNRLCVDCSVSHVENTTAYKETFDAVCGGIE